jgi:signal transduction histidine kinase
VSRPGRGARGDAAAPLAAEGAQVAEARRAWVALLAGMSHELRTPLHTILGFAEILRDRRAGPISARQAEYLGEIVASGQHLLALVTNLVDLALAEAGLIELAPETVHLPEVLVAVLSLLESQSRQKALRVTREVAPEAATIWADPSRIAQALSALLSRAIKATPRGGEVTISARKRIADCGLRDQPLSTPPQPAAEYVEIRVADTGVGVAPQEMEAIFEPFGRGAGAGPERADGARLGLAVARKLVELHGGAIRLESAGAGRGTAVTLRLPLPPE